MKEILLIGFGIYFLTDIVSLGKRKITEYVKDNIDWSWENVKVALVNANVIVTFDLVVNNRNSYGIDLYSIDNAYLYYGQKEIGKVRIPPYISYPFSPNKKTVIPFTINRSLLDLGLTAVEFAASGKFLGKLLVKGTANTSVGVWNLAQEIEITNV